MGSLLLPNPSKAEVHFKARSKQRRLPLDKLPRFRNTKMADHHRFIFPSLKKQKPRRVFKVDMDIIR